MKAIKDEYFWKNNGRKISAIHNNEYAEINNDRINKSYKATSIKNYLKIILDWLTFIEKMMKDPRWKTPDEGPPMKDPRWKTPDEEPPV